MKSVISPTPSGVRKRVIRTQVSGQVDLPAAASVRVGASRNSPPRSASSIEAKMLGASKRPGQNQSTVPSVATRATVRRSPMTPWSSMGR